MLHKKIPDNNNEPSPRLATSQCSDHYLLVVLRGVSPEPCEGHSTTSRKSHLLLRQEPCLAVRPRPPTHRSRPVQTADRCPLRRWFSLCAYWIVTVRLMLRSTR